MKMWKIVLPATALLLFSVPTNAQPDDHKAVADMERRDAEYAKRLQVAEEAMEHAARQIAEITRERLPQMMEIERRFAFSERPMIGITIDGAEDSGPVDGIFIEGVSPGGAADDAGIRAGDIITAVNGEPMGAANSMLANKLLFEFMHGIEEEDVLSIEYARNGNSGKVDLSPRITESSAFFARTPDVPAAIREFRFDGGFPWGGNGIGSMELVKLNAGLGKYFGTDSGLLVVSAPQSDAFKLEDGDVIQSIDGREPKDVRQALKILSTYEAGDSLTLGIMRDKKARELAIDVPESNQRGMLFDLRTPIPVRPASVSLPVAAPTPCADVVST